MFAGWHLDDTALARILTFAGWDLCDAALAQILRTANVGSRLEKIERLYSCQLALRPPILALLV